MVNRRFEIQCNQLMKKEMDIKSTWNSPLGVDIPGTCSWTEITLRQTRRLYDIPFPTYLLMVAKKQKIRRVLRISADIGIDIPPTHNTLLLQLCKREAFAHVYSVIRQGIARRSGFV